MANNKTTGKTSTIVITLLLLAITGLLLYLATTQPEIQTGPTVIEKPVIEIIQQPTPRAEELPRGTPSPRAPEPITSGTPPLQPKETHFWVNDIKIPPQTAYGYFIPLKQKNIKTFIGSYGPYTDDPTPYQHVELCAENYKIKSQPNCEIVPTLYRDGYVNFAQGYKSDEYIGGFAAKDYFAYYIVYSKDTPIAYSNKAIIRTVKD